MLISGKEKLERMRDGRAIYIGAERVDDVTRHPAFRNAARTIAGLYQLKADPQRYELFSFEENGERYGLHWLRCRNREDLARRMRAMKAIADATYGLIGRSPDHVAGLITGLAMNPALLDRLTPGFGENLSRYYDYARKNDLYISFAVTPPSGIRSREIFAGEARDDPTLQVIAEDDNGVTISGMKMLATGAVFADEVWIGNLTAIDDKRQSESITCALPISTRGVSFWAREPYERHARHEADYPLSFRFDETDTVLVCDRVKVPWERVFLHNNGAMSRRIYIETPANCYQNHQSNVRFWAKMGLIVGLASRMCQANGVDKIPAVRETLGRLAALEATVGGLVHGQIEACETWPDGYATPNRRIMYATVNWCQDMTPDTIIEFINLFDLRSNLPMGLLQYRHTALGFAAAHCACFRFLGVMSAPDAGANRRPGLVATHRCKARHDRNDSYQKTDRLAACLARASTRSTGDCYVYFTEPPQRSLHCGRLRSCDGGRHVLHHLLDRRLRGGAMTTSPHTDADRVEANSCLADMAEPIHNMWGLIRTLRIM
ncbi:MAG: 4-hydroxyphenylacetate 3-hydroxylase N-terminal domain-containing protein, partial [Xanthobacteraceae bacterium]